MGVEALEFGKMKIMQWLLILAMGLGVSAFDASARTYYLPDYQDQPMRYSASRSDSISGGGTITPACPPEYKYTDSDCPTTKYDRGSSCGGKYKSCTCKTSVYPTTSTSTGCSAGYVVDASASCTDKPSGETRYACKDDACYGLTSETQCENEGKWCAASSISGCSAYCSECLEKCDYMQKYVGAVSDCELGCAPGREIDGCAGLCDAGGCKTCSPCSADFNLTSKPAASFIYEECTGCDSVVMYKITGCAVNYEYWCDVSNCEALGYKLNTSCGANKMIVRCPYNSAYATCL